MTKVCSSVIMMLCVMVMCLYMNCLGFTSIISLKETVEGLSDLGVFTLSGIFYIRDIEVGLSVGYFQSVVSNLYFQSVVSSKI